MIVRKISYVLVSLLLILTGYYFYFQHSKTGRTINSNGWYELVTDWPKLPATITLGNPTGVGIDKEQNVFVFHRAGREWPLTGSMPDTFIASETILLLNRHTGKVLDSWGANRFIMPHGLTVDDSDNVWVTDVGLHQVFKFAHSGQLLMRLGVAGVSGSDSLHFNLPTDVAVAGDGSFYVSDGYGNSRVVKFSPSGTYLFEWGTRGSNEGQFNIPHGITLDRNENVYVADRENNRVQVFDPAGRFISQWADKSFGSVCAITFDKRRQQLIAVDDARFLGVRHTGSDIIIFDSTGKVQTRLGRSGNYNGPRCWYHDAAVDDEGSIYIGDILGNRLQKFKRLSK